MANDAEPYIAAVSDACQAAGLIVAQYGSDDIDPRDGTIDIVTRPDADPDEDWRDVRTLAWNEERGWLVGRPKDPHGGLTGILYIGAGALPDPAGVAEQARKVIAGEFGADDRRRLMNPVQWRSQDDEDDFEEQLAAYRYGGIAGGQPDEAAHIEQRWLAWLDEYTRREASPEAYGDLRAAFLAGRQSLRDDQEAVSRQVLGELDAEEDPEPGTVGWLCDQTLSYPRDRKVVMAKDAEGNGYSPLAAVEEGMYSATSTWAGEVYQTPEVVAADPGYSPAPDDAERVIVLGPVN